MKDTRTLRFVIIDVTTDTQEVFIDKNGENTDLLEDAKLFRTEHRAKVFVESLPENPFPWWKIVTRAQAKEHQQNVKKQIAA